MKKDFYFLTRLGPNPCINLKFGGDQCSSSSGALRPHVRITPELPCMLWTRA
jgi:hypothetical protein